MTYDYLIEGSISEDQLVSLEYLCDQLDPKTTNMTAAQWEIEDRRECGADALRAMIARCRLMKGEHDNLKAV